MNEAELEQFEQQLRHHVVAELRGVVDQLSNTLNAIYVGAAGSTRHKLPEHTQTTLRGLLVDITDRLREQADYADTRRRLMLAAREAIATGADELGEQVSRQLPLDVRWALRDLTRGMRQDLRLARRLAATAKLDRYGDAMAVAAALRKAATRADRTAAWIVHRAHNEGVQRAVERVASRGEQVAMLWRAEPGACVACRSLDGALTRVGEPFTPTVDVMDASARTGEPTWTPPYHPHCRCGLEPWYGTTDESKLRRTDRPVILRRSAQLALAAGKVDASEPGKVRAADRLLEVADELLIPKRTQRRARKAVTAGRFR